MLDKIEIAVLIPCHNEAISIAKVVWDFQAALPNATVYVYDNNSSDDTVRQALSAGAEVRTETQQGKGHVVRRMFRDIDADFYLMVDGDDTYDAGLAPDMVKLAMSGPYDLINCVRRETEQTAYRGGHRFGNQLLTDMVGLIFGNRIIDMLSGYKVFSRRFVKSFPALATGFDIETELTVHTLELSMPTAHVEGAYRGRPEGSASKLRTYRDGWRILMLINKLLRHERPMIFFGILGGLLTVLSIILIWPVLITYFETGLVPRLPTAILSMGLIVLAALSMLTGVILDTVTRGRRELRLLTYLQYPSPPFAPDSAALLNSVPHRPAAPEAEHLITRPLLQKQLLRQIWRFGLVGVVGYIVNAGMVEFLAPEIGPLQAQGFAFPVAASVTWWCNRRFTFGASHRAVHQEWLRYLLANALGWTANNGVYAWMVFSLPLAYQHPALAVAAGSVAGMVFNFSVSRRLVFNKAVL
jgi:putative flippase GtrA/glycosyltransferase involved in cell wall biosynthesis